MSIEFELITLHNLPEHNVIVGQAHFIKTVEDIHEAMVNAVPGAQFGVAFCEASGDRLIRKSGTDDGLIGEAVRMAEAMGSGHSFVVVMKDMYPINVLPRLRMVPEVVEIFCATANPVQVVVAKTDQGKGIMGVIDGQTPLGVETDKDVEKRKDFLRKIGYKL
jgi:adenosine/AMP kinase